MDWRLTDEQCRRLIHKPTPIGLNNLFIYIWGVWSSRVYIILGLVEEVGQWSVYSAPDLHGPKRTQPRHRVGLDREAS